MQNKKQTTLKRPPPDSATAAYRGSSFSAASENRSLTFSFLCRACIRGNRQVSTLSNNAVYSPLKGEKKKKGLKHVCKRYAENELACFPSLHKSDGARSCKISLLRLLHFCRSGSYVCYPSSSYFEAPCGFWDRQSKSASYERSRGI